jgi:hypothetical protein
VGQSCVAAQLAMVGYTPARIELISLPIRLTMVFLFNSSFLLSFLVFILKFLLFYKRFTHLVGKPSTREEFPVESRNAPAPAAHHGEEKKDGQQGFLADVPRL